MSLFCLDFSLFYIQSFIFLVVFFFFLRSAVAIESENSSPLTHQTAFFTLGSQFHPLIAVALWFRAPP